MVTNEFGVVQGLVTPLDVLEAIAGEFPDEDETPDIIEDGDRWLVKGGADLHSLEQALDCDDLVSPTEDYASLAGFPALIFWPDANGGRRGRTPRPAF
ncbi:Putative Mg2+ and Co2+ transporter CorB [Serratia fonticola]|uniref:Mg2+ and Co2+ transporter CorB n=1 Tax=Serratia fonticola TaxID=47917 RepID=A0A4U9W2Z7_SERFO|nr:Putative Mg2+ and Co2+ transporter CorB [Serratia fonticola]